MPFSLWRGNGIVGLSLVFAYNCYHTKFLPYLEMYIYMCAACFPSKELDVLCYSPEL